MACKLNVERDGDDDSLSPKDDQHPTSPYGILCQVHGAQGLTKDSYRAQMTKPDSFWQCPICGLNAQWDDDRYAAAVATGK